MPFGGEDSVWFVRGVRPLVDALRFCAKACEFEVKTEEAVLPSESESGEVY